MAELTEEQKADLTKLNEAVTKNLQDMSKEQLKLANDLIDIIKNTPEDEQEKGVFHVIVVKHYENMLHASMKFLKETNERGFPSVAQEILARHVLPLHNFLAYQINEMRKQSTKYMKSRMTR